MSLRDKCLLVARTGKGDDPDVRTVSRGDFDLAMAELSFSNDTDKENDHADIDVIDRLFTMFDKTGDDRINHLCFLTGISPLSSLAGANKKLLFAFQVYDVENTGILSSHDIISVLSSINSCVSYFGDEVLSSNEIQELVFDVFQTLGIKGDMDYRIASNIDQLINHPYSVQFLTGQGTVRYMTT